ncbi:hypothetical protein HPB50_016695 [Hyalomma asiaticum]|uniref:Uncharacterized protein n=1 Tax=Hyalomma asiaticum TaxID=266040 RepID=A0ACB7RRG9_HYAAI|nr:hypothetical protein HPB50_016695 [Hyalomma asiaticum]
MDKAAERRARRAAAARARRSDPAVRAREAEASRDSARRRREDPAVRARVAVAELFQNDTLLTSFIERFNPVENRFDHVNLNDLFLLPRGALDLYPWEAKKLRRVGLF